MNILLTDDDNLILQEVKSILGRMVPEIKKIYIATCIADAQKVLEIIESFDGAMPFTDKASSEVIRREAQMSKNEFKRAVGHLLKEGLIQITEHAIRLK